MAHIPLSSELFLGCAVVFIPLSTLALALRFVQRRRRQQGMGIDDWLAVVAYPLVLAMQVTMIVEFSKRELGYPDPNKLPPGIPDASANKPFYPVILESILAIGTIKLSIVFFYRRIFYHSGPVWFQRLSTALIAIIVAWMIAFFFVFVGLCRPNPSEYWASAAAEKQHCVATLDVHRAMPITDILIDIPVLLMSLPIIWTLHMSIGRKLSITAVWLIGLVTIAADLTRTIVIVEVLKVRYDPTIDFEHVVTLAIFWTMIEVGLGYLVANFVTAYSLFATFGEYCLLSIRTFLPTGQRSARSTDIPVQPVQWPAKRGQIETTIESIDNHTTQSEMSEDLGSHKSSVTTTLQQTQAIV